MERLDLDVLSRLEDVWNRVQSGKTISRDTGFRDVERVMEEMHNRISGCRSLAAMTHGCAGKRLLELAEQLEKRYSRLQLHCFLETGDVYFARQKMKFASYTPCNLRKLWQSTVKNTELLEKCNLNGNERLVAELQLAKAEFEQQKKLLETAIEELLQ